jgi:hypothetical protein
MSWRVGFTTLLVVCLASVGATSSLGGPDNWAEGLFSEQGHDFGPVPRGAKVRHAFVLTNRLTESVNIVDVRASCGCTSGRASAAIVPPGKTATVEAEMDTRNFVGPKATTLTVMLMTASGREAEVKFGVRSNILSDIVLNPGSIDFGSLAKGQTPRQDLLIERAGSPAWRVTRVVANPALLKTVSASLVETSRSESGVVYTLTVTLRPEARPGTLRDEIRIMTNDSESPTVPVLVTATVQGLLSAKPSTLDLGHVTSAGGTQGRYLLSGKQPFSIKSIEGSGDGFKLASADSERKSLHVLTLSYRPEEGLTRGDLRRKFRVTTDLPDEPALELNATLHIDP